ncbi:2OG-Fe(II) oxygenase [Hyphococcus sp.]|uniref:2OG-Fe(II) oxygenase n=1 Tax=Hyphococcus sp. TaxID=2038636 RepID=UPI002080831A|nr:MAG: hypothetical protein DHS20C04_24700 [Marinicaulis sp.]
MLSKIAMENLKEIEALARAGDAVAQYRLAAMLDQAGRKDDARAWNEKAAEAGHPGAMYTLACAMLAVPPAEMKVSEAIDLLQRASSSGGAAAMRLLAVLRALGLGVARDWKAAVAHLAAAAKAGHPAAMRELAILAECVSAKARIGDGLIADAARKGDWIAQCFAVRRSGLLSGEEAATMRSRLIAAGVNFIRLDENEQTVSQGLDVDALAALALTEAPDHASSQISLNAAPDIYRVNALLNEDECAYLICASAPLLAPSLVVDPAKGKADHAQYRTSDGALLSLLDLDLVMVALYARLARAAGVDWPNCELIGVLRYRPGQEYKPHHDYLPEDENDYSEVKRSGQRARTLLVVLNDGYEGGATEFPRLKIEFRGGTGDALVFSNTDMKGAPYPETLHAGAPVARGEKWLLSLWCRERRFWFWD